MSSLPLALYLKSLLVGTRIEHAARSARWFGGTVSRRKHPELWEVYLEDYWLPQILKRVLTPTSCVVDVGCHIGSFLSLAIQQAPHGNHVAFEASPEKSGWLKKRFPAVKVYSCAVSDFQGRAVFVEDKEKPGYSHLHRRDEVTAATSSTEHDVDVIRLDDVLDDLPSIDLMKLDIEGGELSALRGARSTIGRHRPHILFECGSEATLKEQGVSRKELYKLISDDLGYKIYSFSEFIFDKGPMGFDEFRKCGLYPFRAFNFVATP